MFTGIVEEIGVVKSIKRGGRSIALEISADLILNEIKIGYSISTNGACLTVTSFKGNSFFADVMPETMMYTNLGRLYPGAPINLERALTLNSRMGGHIVTGHIDGTGKIAAIERDENSISITISAPAKILHYIVKKGSIAIDGVSLTVTHTNNNSFGVSVIPHTQNATTLTEKKAGDIVNIENDIIAKYVEKFTASTSHRDSETKGLSLDFLAKNEF